MYHLSKTEKLKFILEKVKELNLTAYEISKKTNLTEAGIARIINGNVKNPHENTLNSIIEFLEERLVGSNLDENNTPVIKEPETSYEAKTNVQTMMELKNCLDESLKMVQHIYKLQNLLRKNNIAFEDYFEK